jgi:predicted phage gp36 major capsid-like protein
VDLGTLGKLAEDRDEVAHKVGILLASDELDKRWRLGGAQGDQEALSPSLPAKKRWGRRWEMTTQQEEGRAAVLTGLDNRGGGRCEGKPKP